MNHKDSIMYVGGIFFVLLPFFWLIAFVLLSIWFYIVYGFFGTLGFFLIGAIIMLVSRGLIVLIICLYDDIKKSKKISLRILINDFFTGISEIQKYNDSMSKIPAHQKMHYENIFYEGISSISYQLLVTFPLLYTILYSDLGDSTINMIYVYLIICFTILAIGVMIKISLLVFFYKRYGRS